MAPQMERSGNTHDSKGNTFVLPKMAFVLPSTRESNKSNTSNTIIRYILLYYGF